MNKPRACCRAMTPSCLACTKGQTVAEYCRDNPSTPGCEPPRACCLAMKPDCLACMNNQTVAEYCRDNPSVPGCASSNNNLFTIVLIFLIALLLAVIALTK